MSNTSMIAKILTAVGATLCLLVACGDDSSGPIGGSPPAGGSPPVGGSGGDAPLACGANETPAPWRCTCVLGAYPLTDCAADECGGQTGCDVACEDTGGTTSFIVAEYVAGADCDAICGYVCGCDATVECDVYFWCGILPGQDPAMAAESIACQASSSESWDCDANGSPTYNGPATCN